MIYPAPDHLDSMGSKYALVIVTAKRAKQVKDGARRLVESRSTNPLTVALEEIADDQIVPLLVGDPEPLPASVSAGPVLTGLLSTSIDDEVEVSKFDTLLPLTDDLEDLEVEEVAGVFVEGEAEEDALGGDLVGAGEEPDEFLEDAADDVDPDELSADPEAAFLLGDPENEDE